jgi:predicted RNA binding protein YcfA (HicA-like mRNA interferase family)
MRPRDALREIENGNAVERAFDHDLYFPPEELNVRSAGAADQDPWRAEAMRIDRRQFMCMIHTVKSADLIRELIRNGWVLDRVRGSHHVFRHPSKAEILVVPHPRKDLGKGLVVKIRKQAGI